MHHYVPQFYLRNFSTDTKRKFIGLYNFNNKIFIQSAPIKHQACEKYLYGTDDVIESELSKMEFYSSKVLERLQQCLIPPPANSLYFKLLKKYILYQYMRTVKAGNEMQQRIQVSTGELFKVMSQYDKKYEGLVGNFEDPVIKSLVAANDGLALLEFLDCKILINNTKVPFITSDNPVARYNRFAELKNAKGGLGWAVKGFQIFFPLNPFAMLVLFDQFVYKYGTDNKTQIVLSEEKDVDQLNSLQFLSCESQMFFGRGISREYLEVGSNKFLKIKSESREIAVVREREIQADGKRPIQMLNTSRDPQINLTLTFLKLTKPAKKYILPNNLSCVRHESLNKFRRTKLPDWRDYRELLTEMDSAF